MEKNKEQIMMGIQSENELTEMISVNVICRLCANENDKLIGIYSEDGISNDLATKMNLYLPIKVNDSDDLPLQCCWQCASTVLAWHDLVVTSVEADRRLRSYQFVAPKHLENVHENFENNKNDVIADNVELCETSRSTPMDEETVLKRHIKYENNLDEPEVNSVASQDIKVQSDQQQIDYYIAVDTSSCTCLLCSKSFATESSLKKHMTQKHNLKQQKIRRRKCEINSIFECFTCCKSFTRKYDMEKHIINKHPNKKDTIIPSKRASNLEIVNRCKITSDKGTYFQCDFCKSRFHWSQSFLRHRKKHTGEKMHCCHICGKNFVASTSLKRHLELFHYSLKRFSCSLCHKKFGVKSSRDEHMNIHTNLRPFMCDQCGKSFRQRASLSVHRLFHSNSLHFPCMVCNKGFRRKSDLKEHHWTHIKEKT